MSRFHNYSLNNQALIHLQRPDATFVAGYNRWRDKFSRHVLRGEKGITIIAPTPYKKKIEQEKLDPDTKLPILDADGNTEEVEAESMQALRELSGKGVWIQSAAEPDAFRVNPFFTYGCRRESNGNSHSMNYGKLTAGTTKTAIDTVKTVRKWRNHYLPFPNGRCSSSHFSE